MDSAPPRARGGSLAPELQDRRDRCPCGPRSGYRPAPEASTLPPLGVAARRLLHPHPRSLWPSAPASLAPGSTRRGRTHTASNTTSTPGPTQLPSVCKLLQWPPTSQRRLAHQPAPDAAHAHWRLCRPGPAPLTWHRPRDPARVSIGPRRRPAPSAAPPLEDAAGHEDRLGQNCRSWLRIGPRHGSRPGCSSRDFCQHRCPTLRCGTPRGSRCPRGLRSPRPSSGYLGHPFDGILLSCIRCGDAEEAHACAPWVWASYQGTAALHQPSGFIEKPKPQPGSGGARL